MFIFLKYLFYFSFQKQWRRQRMGKTNWLFQLCWVIRWIKSWWRLIASIDWRNAPWWYWHQKWSFETSFHERTNQFEENGRLFQVYDTDEMINNFITFFSSTKVSSDNIFNLILSCFSPFSCDQTNLSGFLCSIGQEFSVYTYDMLKNHLDRETMLSINEEQLLSECGIKNRIHRLKIFQGIKVERG